MNNRRWWIVPSSVALLLLTLSASAVAADIATFDLTVPNSAITGFPGPFVKVTIDLKDASNATITYEAYGSYFLAGPAAMALNIAGTGWSVSSVSGFPAPHPGGCSSSGHQLIGNACVDTEVHQVDGFGLFNLQLSTNGTGSTVLSFTLTGGNWDENDAMSVIFQNPLRHASAVALVMVTNSCGGYAGNPGSTSSTVLVSCGVVTTPEPSSLVLFGAALLGLAVVLGRQLSA